MYGIAYISGLQISQLMRTHCLFQSETSSAFSTLASDIYQLAQCCGNCFHRVWGYFRGEGGHANLDHFKYPLRI